MGNRSVVFARGMTISTSANPVLANDVRPYWTECGKVLRKFNEYVLNDPRVDVTMLPLFDGVSMIKWKLDVVEESNATNGDLSNVTNGDVGNVTNGDLSK